MVKYNKKLDTIFGSLSDHTRRDILKRVAEKELPVSEIAAHYRMSLPAISKHLRVLEAAGLIRKKRRGRQFFVTLSPPGLKEADEYLEHYRKMWEERMDRLEKFLSHK